MQVPGLYHSEATGGWHDRAYQMKGPWIMLTMALQRGKCCGLCMDPHKGPQAKGFYLPLASYLVSDRDEESSAINLHSKSALKYGLPSFI